MCKPAAGKKRLSMQLYRNISLLTTFICACGIPGYTCMGVYKQVQKITKADVSYYIVAAHIAQGEEEYRLLGESQRLDIVSHWNIAKLHQ